MNCLGTLPPTTFASNTKPEPRSVGSIAILTWPYWPWPPVCFLCRYSALAFVVTVSRYATSGIVTSTSTP